jgi:uncharacterized protein
LIIITIALIWTFGLLGMSGMPFSVITSVIPVILFPIGVASAIHVFKTYIQRRQSGESHMHSIEQTFAELLNPILLSAITTFVGFASFSFSRVIWTRTFGIFAAIGVALALLLSIVMLPIFLAFDRKAAKMPPRDAAPVDKLLDKGGFWRIYRDFVVHKWAWVFVLAAIAATSAIGLSRMRVEGNPISMFPPKSAIRQSDALISKHLGGTRFLTILLRHKHGPLKSAEQWEDVRQIRDYARKLDIVGETSSMLPLITRVSKMLTDKEIADPAISMIIGGKSLFGKKFSQYSANWISPDQTATKIALVCQNVSGTRFLSLSKELEAYIRDHYADWEVIVAGPPVLNDAMTYVLIETQISSMIIALISVFLVLCILFRSVRLGLFAIVPIVLSTVFVYALMGLFGITVNVITVIIVNTCIGIGIDYAIHFVAGYSYLRPGYSAKLEAIMAAARRRGTVIMFNTAIVGIGFLILAFSSFPPIRDFGVFVFISMTASSIFSLVFLPVLIRMFEPEIKAENTHSGHISEKMPSPSQT